MSSLILYIGFSVFLTMHSLIFKRNVYFLLLTTSFFYAIFYGLREGIGNDYAQYENIYNQINAGLYSAIEPTYIILSKLLRPFDYGFNFLMAFYTFCTYLLCYIGIKKYNIYSYAPILMFSTGFIFYADNQVRQALATAFFIYYMRFIPGRELWKYVLCVTISTVFLHFSSAILIFAYLVPKKRIKSYIWCVLLVLAFVLMKVDAVHTILINIISHVPYYSELYIQRFNDMVVISEGSGLGVVFWIVLAMFILAYQYEIDEPVLVNLFIIGTIINVVFINYDIFERVSFYLIYLRFILLCIIIKKIIFKDNLSFMLSAGVILLTLAFSSYEVMYDANKHGSVPLELIYYQAE